jgi:hypothetical protein
MIMTAPPINRFFDKGIALYQNVNTHSCDRLWIGLEQLSLEQGLLIDGYRLEALASRLLLCFACGMERSPFTSADQSRYNHFIRTLNGLAAPLGHCSSMVRLPNGGQEGAVDFHLAVSGFEPKVIEGLIEKIVTGRSWLGTRIRWRITAGLYDKRTKEFELSGCLVGKSFPDVASRFFPCVPQILQGNASLLDGQSSLVALQTM